MATPIETLQAQLDAAYAARLKILESQEYTVSDGVIQRRNRRADLEAVNATINDLEAAIAILQPPAVARRVLRIVPGC